MKQVFLVTGHYLQSKRQAGFHWLADAYWRAGWEVTFFTAALSWLSRLRGDFRFAYPVRCEANKLKWVRERMASYVWYTKWHPANLRLGVLNKLASGKFSQYGELPLGEAENQARQADLIIFESTPGLLLFERFKRLNPTARFVYRVSDDLDLLRNHGVVLAAERRLVPQFDMVSVPSNALYERFAGQGNLHLHHHGIAKHIYDRQMTSPYAMDNIVKVVFIGSSHVDVDAIDRASRQLPSWQFHIIGKIAGLPRRRNVIAHGEAPFVQVVPYIKHADIGLHAVLYKPGAESFSDSLKVIQYSYCRLPIVAPQFLRPLRPNVVSYRPEDDESIRQAMLAAREIDRAAICTDDISSWDDLAKEISGPLWETGNKHSRSGEHDEG